MSAPAIGLAFEKGLPANVEAERSILGAIGYSPNTVYLHRDPGLMPKRRRA